MFGPIWRIGVRSSGFAKLRELSVESEGRGNTTFAARAAAHY
jgi:hypothetical protein